METKLARISQMSRENPTMIFTSVGHLIDKEMLKSCHEAMDGTKAKGIDGVSKADYEEHLDENLDSLVDRSPTKASSEFGSLKSNSLSPMVTFIVLIENAIREYKKNSNDRAYLNSLEAELKEVQRKLDNMIKAIEDGVYTETTRSRLIELEERRDALDQAIMVEQAKNELFQDVGFGELYKRYLDADLDNPELRDELLDYFVDKIYIDDDGKLSFVLKLYDKDEVELQEVSEDEIFDFVGVEVFDNFTLCSTRKPCRSKPARFFCARFSSLQSMQILHGEPWDISLST